MLRYLVSSTCAGLAITLSGCAGTTTSTEPARSSPPASDSSGDGASSLLGAWNRTFDDRERRAVLADFAGHVDHADRIEARLAFVDENDWWLGFLFDGELYLLDGFPEGDGGTYSVDGDKLVMLGAHDETRITYRWRIDDAQLTLRAVEECTVDRGEVTACRRDRAAMEPLMLMLTEHAWAWAGDDVGY